MNCPACGFEFNSEKKECPRCGLIISRYKKRTIANPVKGLKGVQGNNRMDDQLDGYEESWLSSLLFYVKPKADSTDLILRIGFSVIISLWGLILILTAKDGEGGGFGFWHLVNLPFHEAGHVFLRPFNHLIMSLGGTLGQLAMPMICMGVFLLKTRDTFAAGFCLWWFGLNFLDISPYIGDARSLTLPLLGGNIGSSSPYGFHDWEYILTETGLLAYDKIFANLAFITGVVLMSVACLWWFVILKKYHENMES